MAKKGPKYYPDVIQGSPEWLMLRDPMLTASIATPLNPKGIGKGLQRLIREKAYARLGIPDPDEREFKGNEDTEVGHLLEPKSRAVFSQETGLEVTEMGFIGRLENEWIGCSPDGLIGDSGGWESKSYALHNHLKVVRSGKIPAKVISQCQWSMWVSDRDYWYACFYRDNAIPEEQLFYKRIERDEKKMAFYDIKVPIVIDLIKFKMEEIQRGNNTTVVDKEIEDLFGEWG